MSQPISQNPAVTSIPKLNPEQLLRFTKPSPIVRHCRPHIQSKRSINMSASPARKSANTANAQLSTGPRTPEGKSRSAQNASKHGLTAADLVIGPEDRA